MNNVRKIIFFIPNIERGGIEKNFLMLTKFFVSKNYIVHVLYSKISNDILTKIDKRVILKKSKNYIKVFNFFFSIRVINSINCFFYFFFKIKKEKNSIIFSMQDHPFAIILGKVKKINTLIRIANHPNSSLKFFNGKILFLIKRFIKLFFYRLAEGIICNSNSSKLFLKKKINNNIVTIYNPIILKKKIINKKRNNILLTVGRLEKQKNFLGLIDAFNIVLKEFPNFKLIIVGNGSEKDKLINKLKKLNIFNKVIIKDFAKPNNFFLTSKIFILNSFFEGMPNVLLEALLYKCPIISTDCESGPREILKNNKYGYLVPVNNYELLAQKIKFALNNYHTIKNKTEKGFLSLKNFSYKVQCEKYEKFISKFYENF